MELICFFLFTFAVGFTLFKVVIKVASWLELRSVPMLPIWRVPFPFVKVNLSSVRSSVVPSARIKLYLSSSKGKNVSLSPAWTAVDNSSADALIVTLNTFLIDKDALSNVTSDITVLGKGV